jgi:hypothetical protein
MARKFFLSCGQFYSVVNSETLQRLMVVLLMNNELKDLEGSGHDLRSVLFRPRFEPSTFRIEVYSVAASSSVSIDDSSRR